MAIDYEARFQEVIAALEEILTDVKVSIDFFEVDLVKIKETGMMSCETHTGIDHIRALALMNDNLSLMHDFYALAGTYHTLEKHIQEVPREIYDLFIQQEHALYRELCRYKEARAHYNREREASGSTSQHSTINPDNWYEDLLKRRGDKSDGPN